MWLTLGVRAILALVFPDASNMPLSPSPSLAVLGFALLVSLATGILFGAAPAWLSFHAQPAEALRGVSRTTRDRSSLPQKALVVFQAALSVVLLAGAILMTKTLTNLQSQNFGVVTENRYVLHFDPQGAGYTVDTLPALYREIQDRFSALPGMSNASLALYSPLEGDNWSDCVIQQGHSAPRQGEDCDSTWDRVDTHFLDAVGVPIVRGRGITEQDTATSPQVAIVNEAFVKKFFPHQDPIGRRFGLDLPSYSGSFEIVGVFRDFKMNLQYTHEGVHAVYLRPLVQQFTDYKESNMVRGETRSMFVNAMILDFHSAPPNVDALVRHTLAGINPNLTVQDLRTFDNQLAGNFTEQRVVARLTGLFGSAGACARLGRTLWSDVVLCCAAHQRDRHPHGAGRDAAERGQHGDARRTLADPHRPRAGDTGVALCWLFDEGDALRSRQLRFDGPGRSTAFTRDFRGRSGVYSGKARRDN